MQILFAISMLCFFALLGAILALIKRAMLVQRLLARGFPVASTEAMALKPATRSHSHQDVHNMAPHKHPDWRFMVNADRADTSSRSLPTSLRKSPQSTSFGTRNRLDWAYFNKDLGDLSDPYEPQRPTGTSGPLSNKS